MEALTQNLREKLSIDLQEKGKVEIEVSGVGDGKVEIGKDLINIEKRTRIEHVREYTPNVIEPAFGIGRILYSLLEHVYWSREGSEARGVSFGACRIEPFRLINPRSSHSLHQSPLPRFYWFRCLAIRISNHWSNALASSCVS